MSKKLWGGRFKKKTDPLVERFTRSIQYDHKLAAYDIRGSHLHLDLLTKSGYLSRREAQRLHKGLDAVAARLKGAGYLKAFDAHEDIHTYIQNELQKQVGPLALKLHTARSRNDQVAFDTRLYAKVAVCLTIEELEGLSAALAGLAAKNHALIIPGFTHLQHAQPVYARDYLGAYMQMFARDKERLTQAEQRIALTQGSGALAGTPVPAACYRIKGKLAPPVNALDTVSDRDFVIEIISCLALVAMHLSRLAEDLVIYASKEFEFIEIDEAYCTGSSLMPQKKNPDVLELIRGSAGRVYGDLMSVLTMMKGLPLSYNRDMQLDKEPLFHSFELSAVSLKVMAGLIKTLKFNKSSLARHLADESLYATDLVYYLVDRGSPFKEAHTTVGKLVQYSLDRQIPIQEMPEALLQRFSKKFKRAEIAKYFDPQHSVALKKSIAR